MNTVVAGMERLKYQSGSKLAEELDDCFGAMRRQKRVELDHLKDTKIEDVIKKHTGMKIRFSVSSEDEIYSYPPFLDRNHPLLHHWGRNISTNSEAEEALGTNPVIVGKVDFEKGRVSGVYSEIEYRIFLPGDFLSQGSPLTAAQVTAIVLHELGHGFHAFALMGYTLTTSFVIQQAVAGLLNEKSTDRKYEIMMGMEKQPGFRISDKDALMTCKTKEEIIAVVITDSVLENKSEFGAPVTDSRSLEIMADKYVSVHGRGRDLATAIDTLVNRGFNYDNVYKPIHWVINLYIAQRGILLTTLVILFVDVAFVMYFLLIALVLRGRWTSVGDSTKERYGNIKNDIVFSLRNEKDKDRRAMLLADLDAVDELEKKTNDNRFWIGVMMDNIFPALRGRTKSKDVQRSVERLMQNSLFESKERLDQLV